MERKKDQEGSRSYLHQHAAANHHCQHWPDFSLPSGKDRNCLWCELNGLSVLNMHLTQINLFIVSLILE